MNCPQASISVAILVGFLAITGACSLGLWISGVLGHRDYWKERAEKSERIHATDASKDALLIYQAHKKAEILGQLLTEALNYVGHKADRCGWEEGTAKFDCVCGLYVWTQRASDEMKWTKMVMVHES